MPIAILSLVFLLAGCAPDGSIDPDAVAPPDEGDRMAADNAEYALTDQLPGEPLPAAIAKDYTPGTVWSGEMPATQGPPAWKRHPIQRVGH